METLREIEVLSFDIIRIQTITFPIPIDCLNLRNFFVSVSDGRTTQSTSRVKLQARSLQWNETLAGFSVGSSSQLTLRVLEENEDCGQDGILATFLLTYQMLCLTKNEFLVSSSSPVSQTISITLSPRRVPAPSQNLLQGLPQAHYIDRPLPGRSPTATSVATASSDISAFLYKLESVRKRVDFVVRAVGTISEIHPYARLAWSTISLIPDTMSEQIQLNGALLGVIVLLGAMEQALHLAPSDKPLRATKLKSRCERSEKCKQTVTQMMALIAECGYFIQSYSKDVDFRNGLEESIARNETNVIAKLRQQLKEVHDAFVGETVVNVDTNILHILDQVESLGQHLDDLHLDTKFPFVQGARFNPEKGCLPGTRLKFLDAIIDWANNVDPLSPKALVLFGQAGTGKSSIAHEIANIFYRAERLTASYCFVRGKPSSREPHRFFTTLARNLSARYPAYKSSLYSVIKQNPDLLSAEDYTTLFMSLVVKPLKDLRFLSPVFIVIDALDESEDASSRSPRTSGNRIPFHTFLGKYLCEFPAGFRILITSRPEAELEEAFPESSFVRRMNMNDAKLADGVYNDILIYTRARLHTSFVDENDLRNLAKKAEGLFQWAYVACDYIAKPPPGLNASDCLEEVLDSSQASDAAEQLNELYRRVLEAHFNMGHSRIRDNFQSVMGQVLGTFEPLSITSLNILRQHPGGRANNTDVSNVIKYMGSLLSNVNPSDSTLLIAPLHTSFRDFLTDPERSHKFYVNLDNIHRQLAYATLGKMQEMLRFNICELETSYCLNSEVPDLEDRIEKYIPPALSYSCRFWADHLAQVPMFDTDVFQGLQLFMEENFLFWLEVLSVRGEVPVATKALLMLRTWLDQMRDETPNEGIDILDARVKDAIAFVQYFGYPIAQSIPHIYLSALPFAPSSSLIAELYSLRFPRILSFEYGRLTQWPALVMTISVPPKDSEKVVCVTWNDEYIAAGLLNGNVFVWSSLTGTRLSEPFNAARHSAFVTSIVFSHDGLCLVSGLSDGSIWRWILRTGQEAAVEGQMRALEGHTGAVSALSFSEDGRQLISGSADHTVLIWDFENGEIIAGPFRGHKNPVWAVSFLPDQEHVVSRSGLRTVRVWNVKTGQSVMKPFKDTEIPTGTIDSADYYYDDYNFFHESRRVKNSFAACSWTEAMEGEAEYEDKYCWTQAVAFSRDSKFVATSSCNQTHVWYANGRLAGKLAGGPFNNINRDVLCLAFSADGQRIASGSSNGIVDVWDVRIVNEDASGSAEQEVPVSVAFTPDGSQIIVGWDNGAVHVLDAPTGQEVVTIKEGNEERIWPKVMISLNGDLIASTNEKEMRIWTRMGEEVAVVTQISSDDEVWSIAFSPNSNELIAFGTFGGTVYLLNTSTQTSIAGPTFCTKGVTSLALFSTTNDATTVTRTHIAVGSDDGEIFIWDTYFGIVRGPFLHHRNRKRITALIFSVKGHYITSVAADDTLCVWDSTSGNIVRGPVGPSDDQKVYLDAGPGWSTPLTQDGRRVAFVGKQHTIVVFKVVYEGDSDITLQSPLVLACHTDLVTSVTFSRDGQFFATTSHDRTVRIWDLQAAAEHKHDSGSSSSDMEIANFDEARIDNDGWAICMNSRGGSPLRLMWIPEMHRQTLHRPSNVCVVGCQKQTRLDLKNYVHGKDWVKCKASC